MITDEGGRRILVVAPVPDIYHSMRRIVAERGLDDVDVVYATMQRGLEEALRGVCRGAEVIVSRGGTFELIRQEVSVPVVEIGVSPYDVIEALCNLPKDVGRVAVVGFEQVVYGFDIICKIMPLDIVKIHLDVQCDIAQEAQRYRDAGIAVCIGDSNARQVARILGCRAVIISSRYRLLTAALVEARRIVDSIEEEKRRAQSIITMTDAVPEGVLAIDHRERITVFNRAAEEMFGIPREEALGRPVTAVVQRCRLPDLFRDTTVQMGQMLELPHARLVINRAAIMVDGRQVGAVATMQRMSTLQHVEQRIRRSLSDRGFTARYGLGDILCGSAPMREAVDRAREYAPYDSPVLILGESGVGKEMFSQGIHNAGLRREGPFVAINCAAIPASLIESELFGYEEGAFTGAGRKGRSGIFELAHNGTVFLDEIGDLPLRLQGRLLRVLQERQIMRIGGSKVLPVDIRIICATNRDLAALVEKGQFRRDLYYRINVLTLEIPSLRESGPEHVLLLADHFLRHYAERYGRPVPALTPEARALLTERRFSGNVRELMGLMERCVILSSLAPLAETRAVAAPSAAPSWAQDAGPDLRSMELAYIRHVYALHSNNATAACKTLGISRATLWRKLGESVAQGD